MPAPCHDDVERVAESVLYEGYLLWPYRRSALKNRQRWTFGGVYPERFADGTDRAAIETQCLVETDGAARIDVTVRFLQVVERRVARVAGERLTFVDEIVVGDDRHLAWDEAVERTVHASVADGETAETPIVVDGDTATEWVAHGTGAIVRSWRSLRGTVDVEAEPLRRGISRVAVRIANTTTSDAASRDAALRETLVSTHAILRVAGGAFVSLMDPPPSLSADAAACRNVGLWPVLAGREGDRHAMLASPVILYDWPRIAPESPGDLFDATEIDQLLVLSVLALTEDEQREMRASDPRAGAILDRCARLTDAERARLHGAIRSFRALGDP